MRGWEGLLDADPREPSTHLIWVSGVREEFGMGQYEHLKLSEVEGVCVVRFMRSRITDPDYVEQVGNELVKLIDTDKKTKILVNFDGVQFLSSAALGKLMKLDKRIRTASGQLELCNLGEVPREAFRITRLDDTFNIHETQQDAISAF